jgi:predicted  nucleic acid-binding Zn-ribbon protein
VERANHRQESVKRLEEIDRLTAASNAQQDELSALRQELAERLTDQDEEQDFLARAQNEIESLRLDLTAKDEELERLREAVSSPTKDDPHSLDHELLSSLRQQHALDLSAAQSQIRALENSVFDAEAKSHALRKQLSTLEDQLAQTRGAVAHRALSPSIPSTSRPASRAASVRTGLGAGAPSLARSVFDQNLTPETRHKRKVSLSMLKARIDSEVAAHALAHQHSRPSSRALSPVQSVDGDARPTSPPLRAPAPFHRPQFLDDSHVFWCHSCRGDLVIL